MELVFQDWPVFVYTDTPNCPDCTRVLADTVAVAPEGPAPTFDVAITLDGGVVVSNTFRSTCSESPGVKFWPIAGRDDVWLLDAEPVVQLEPFDSHVKRGPECLTCGHPRYVTRSGPLVLAPHEVLPRGFSKTDIAFGDTADFGPTQPARLRPSLFVDRSTAKLLKSADLLGIHLIAQP